MIIEEYNYIVYLLGRNDWGISSKREMNTRVRDQIGLELSQVDV